MKSERVQRERERRLHRSENKVPAGVSHVPHQTSSFGHNDIDGMSRTTVTDRECVGVCVCVRTQLGLCAA